MKYDKVKETERTYGYLWEKESTSPLKEWHFNHMQEVIKEPIVRGSIGIEIGSGCGYDTYIIAKNNSSVTIVSVDISDGVKQTKALSVELKNVKVVKCSALDVPFKDKTFDFAYSFGVLHHTDNPQKGLLEIAKILKKDSPAFLYLYENHSENFVKSVAIKLISNLRVLTIRIPSKLLYTLACIFSPLVFLSFTVPSKVLRRFKITQHYAENMPFNFGKGLFSLREDLYDRFGAPIEHRFSRQEVYDLFTNCGFCNISITRLKNTAGWVVWGYKK